MMNVSYQTHASRASSIHSDILELMDRLVELSGFVGRGIYRRGVLLIWKVVLLFIKRKYHDKFYYGLITLTLRVHCHA